MWLSPASQHHRYDLHCDTGAREVPRTEHDIYLYIYIFFIDLTKAFDMVNIDALWVILRKLVCPAKFTKLIQLIHIDMKGEVLSGEEPSDQFTISNGMKQSFVFALVLFNLFFTQVLLHAVRDLNLGVYISYHLNDSLFDLQNKDTGEVLHRSSLCR